MSDMTCKELRWYLHDHLRDAEVRCARGAIAEHAAKCPDCSRFVTEQRELGRSLREIRESVGPVPQSVETSVVLNYRRHMADKGARFRATNRKLSPRLAWGMAALAAALLVIAGSLLRSRHSGTGTTVRAMTTQTNAISVTEAPKNPISGVRPLSTLPEQQRRIKPKLATVKRVRPLSPERVVSLPARSVRSLPEGFRSLMYCDELSCPPDMEMIRVQLPSSAMPRHVSSFIQASGSVTADVLVGPDGIARGIRFEEIEF
jgi:hypothetical protein